MCDFKPGDDIVAVEACTYVPEDAPLRQIEVGRVYVCAGIDDDDDPCTGCGSTLWVTTQELGEGSLFSVCLFRKVQKRNDRLTIEAFLTIKPGQFEEPRRERAPAKKRERV